MGIVEFRHRRPEEPEAPEGVFELLGARRQLLEELGGVRAELFRRRSEQADLRRYLACASRDAERGQQVAFAPRGRRLLAFGDANARRWAVGRLLRVHDALAELRRREKQLQGRTQALALEPSFPKLEE